ncbi:hypothetical protein [Alkalihalobacillus sp. LMS39]|uniref:hypothetical protein n=1 Tax=Alkalihalobacillus sp. LMS39 TaxID=2924032 RepID=UPI001FB3AED7|nr:hypothetical protein [Alkalihalobacillus sp. LMS39]UOE92572.1 hypothetical protein MM271_15165 [Alkalihalobacillus sp. LMS39]
MDYNQLTQIVLLTQDAKALGWDFSVEENRLTAIDSNYQEDPVQFDSTDQLLEWFEDQFDKRDSI